MHIGHVCAAVTAESLHRGLGLCSSEVSPTRVYDIDVSIIIPLIFLLLYFVSQRRMNFFFGHFLEIAFVQYENTLVSHDSSREGYLGSLALF